MTKIMRIYDSYDQPGFRILVDRIWPRGVSKQKAKLDLWAKDIAPTKELRTWFNHEDEKFPEFKSKYFQELQKNPYTSDFLQLIKEHPDVILLFGAKNIEHNQAVVLLEYIKKELD
ncbi:hypothetical protein RD055328_12080 [Companilactobacillus sp. RD055328]|nr:DUF488 family protein [Companilactobacillus sp. RD055328]GKQ43285.1 hypothetical protein RD055328_12080 [Companilactobacillus sp. RD055328]